MTCHQGRACIFSAGVFIATLVGPSVSQGQTGRGVPWIGPDLGNWTVVANWDNFAFGQPLREFAEEGIINNNTTVIVNTAVNDSTPPPPASGGTSSTTGGVVVGGAFTPTGGTASRGDGGLTIQSGGALNVQSGTYTNTANVTLTSSGDLVAGLTAAAAPNPVTTGTVTVNSGGSLTVGNGVILGNAGVGTLTVNGGGTVSAGHLMLGQAGGGIGTATIQNGANVTVANAVQVGQAGRGTLTVNGGGTLTAGRLNSGGAGGATPSTLALGDASGLTATVTSNGPTSLLRTTRITGPNVNFTSQGPLTLPSSQTLIADIRHASNHSPIKSPSSASVDGTLKVEFTGVTPTLGNAWNIIDANSISGTFNTIDSTGAPALGAAQAYQTRQVAGGTNGRLLQVVVEQLLTLQVNRQTGAVSIKNVGPGVAAANVPLDGYTILSAHGGLSGGAWNSLADQAVAGWQEAPAQAGALSELNTSTSTTIAGGQSRALGTPYTAMFPAFQIDPDDVTWEYTTSNGLREGLVEYVGTKVQNNLVLTVNPTTGAATLKNDSPFTVQIEGYSILSPSGALRPANGQWNSLSDQGTPNWTEAAPTANALSELAISGSLTVASNATFNLGNLFMPASMQDLSFEFLLLDDPDAVSGVVLYGAPGFTADFNDDGSVNGADLAVWRSNFGPGNANADADGDGDSDGNDFLAWQRQLGSTSSTAAAAAVPEPSTLLLSALVGVLFCRRSRRSAASAPALDTRKRSAAMFSPRNGSRLAMAFVGLLAWVLLAGAPAARAADVLLVGGQLGSSDIELISLLKTLGHTVVNEDAVGTAAGNFFTGPPSPAQLTGVDMILFSRTAESTQYDDGTEAASWNTLNVPLILMNSALVRGGSATLSDNRWGWTGSSTLTNNVPSPTNFDAPFPNPSHPFVAGRTTDVFPPNQTIDYIAGTSSPPTPGGSTTVAVLSIPLAAGGTFQTPGILDIPAGSTLFADAQNMTSVTTARRVFFQMYEYPDTTDVFALSTNGGMILDQIINTLGGIASSRAGDVDGDGDVDINDFNVIRNNFQTSVTSRTLGDLTGDGFVDLADFREWKDNDPLAATASGAAVPEPGGIALALLAIGGAALTRWRKRTNVPHGAERGLTIMRRPLCGSVLSCSLPWRRWPAIAVLAILCCLAANRLYAANIIWVSDGADDPGAPTPDDQPFVDLLVTAGHTVEYVGQKYRAFEAGEIDTLAAADLIIVSRQANSGQYDDGTETTEWNSLEVPLILMGSFLARGAGGAGTTGNQRWHWLQNSENPDSFHDGTTADPLLEAVATSHPIFSGVTLDANNKVALTTGSGMTFVPISSAGNGTLIGKVDSLAPGGADQPTPGAVWIAEWQAGTPFYEGSSQTPLGHRMLFLAGASHNGTGFGPSQDGDYNLSSAGEIMFTNAVSHMLGFQPAHPGDVDEDGDVDINDFNAIRDHFQQSATMRDQGDLTGDGFVDWKDFRQWKDNHPFTPPPATAAGGAVPEPAGMLLGLISLAAVTRAARIARRRRSSYA